MKLELTLKCELTRSFLSLLLSNHAYGWRAETEIPVGLWAPAWCLIRVIFCFSGNSEISCACSWAQDPGRLSHRCHLVILRSFSNVSSKDTAPDNSIYADVCTVAVESELLPTVHCGFDWPLWAQGALTLHLHPGRMGLWRQVGRGLFSSYPWGLCDFSTEAGWSSLKGNDAIRFRGMLGHNQRLSFQSGTLDSLCWNPITSYRWPISHSHEVLWNCSLGHRKNVCVAFMKVSEPGVKNSEVH